MSKAVEQKREVYISAGHTNIVGKDRGAVGSGYVEGDLTVEFRDLVCIDLDTLHITYVKDQNAHALAETVKEFKGITKESDLVIDIHFNAATATATGCEVFVPHDATKTELDLAENCAQCISLTLGIPLRGNFKGRKGVKSEQESNRKDLVWMRLAGQNILLEVCFISNPNDMAKYQKFKEALAYNIASSIARFAVTVDTKEPTKAITYTVVSGDYLSKIAQKHNVTVTHIKTSNGLLTDNIYVGQTLKI